MLFKDKQKPNYKYMQDPLYLLYWERWDISQKLLEGAFERFEDISQCNKHFTKNHNENYDTESFLEIDAWYFTKLSEINDDLLFLPENIQIGKFEKLAGLKRIWKYFFMLMNGKTMKKVGKQKIDSEPN